jgi:hypothetical protein
VAIIVTAWQNAVLTLGTKDDYLGFLDRYASMGFEVKTLSTFGHVERNGNVVQYFNLVMQRPVAWSDSAGQVNYPG